MTDRTEVGTVVASNTNDGNKHRGYMITINNPSEMDLNGLKTDDYQYCMYQIERGTGGTEHIQAFIYYTNPRVWPKRKYPRGHIEVARDIKACIAYCSKSDTRVAGPFECGVKPNQGRRTDLEEIAMLAATGGMAAVVEQFPVAVVRYHRGLKALVELSFKHRSGVPWVGWLWGSAGAGKTRDAVARSPDSFYIKDGTQWWDGYTQQKLIIIDDFDGKWPFRDLLRLLDRYPYQGQTKGGYVPINSDIIITCEFPPDHFWEANELNQVVRRITEIRRVVNLDIVPPAAAC